MRLRVVRGKSLSMALWLKHSVGKGLWNHSGHAGYNAATGTCALNLDRNPAPCVQAGGIWASGDHWIELDADDDGMVTVPKDRPLYRVPLIAELPEPAPDAPVVASTFSGAGGSCYGYELAGYRVAWANEFVPAAQDTYRANHPTTILDPRDIRIVQPDEILDALGLQRGELDLFDGSPPCQSFSIAGRREKNWGKVASHTDGSTQRSDDLFFEYARLVEGLQPRVFIAENVKGLTIGTAKGYFQRIHRALVECGYRVEARIVDAQWCGVPQTRARVIFQGIRADLADTTGQPLSPAWPDPLPYRITTREAISNIEVELEPEVWLTGSVAENADLIPPGKTGEAAGNNNYWGNKRLHPDRPAHAILASDGGPGVCSAIHPTERRRLSIPEVRRICSFPDDYVLTGTYAEQWARLGNSVPPLMMERIATTVRTQVLDRATRT